MKHLSMLGAWALAFGCAVGWDVFVLPQTEFLPRAGLLGSVIGLVAGGLLMAVIAWNYHVMMCRCKGSGGVYAYAKSAFGVDHGFLCGWFLCLAYVSIVLADATALIFIARYIFGESIHFGIRYTIGGYTVCMGDIILSFTAVMLAAAICCRKRLAASIQTLMAVALALGIVVCFVAEAVFSGGPSPTVPFFAQTAVHPFLQIAGVIAISPWLFVGFEAMSNASDEFRFPVKRSFGIMAAAIAAAVVAYVLATLLSGIVADGWAQGAGGEAEKSILAYEAAAKPIGLAGKLIVSVTLLFAVFTNLIGNMFAASRMIAAMADDGALPAWFAHRNADSSPRNAVVFIAAVSLFSSALGRSIIEMIVDMAIMGAAVAYAYTSAAAIKAAHENGSVFTCVTGFVGLILSCVLAVFFILPNFFSDAPVMETESYLVLVMWCVAGIVAFLAAFRRDARRRFGHSAVVWISLLSVIMMLSIMWARRAANDATTKISDDIDCHHKEYCIADETYACGDRWHMFVRNELSLFGDASRRNTLVQMCTALLSFSLMFAIFSILRKREREIEEEKSRAKSYFFSSVSHDIRTPLNAIIGFSEMLKAGFKTEEERSQAIDAILVSGKTLLGLVNDVLDLSKLEAGKMEILPVATDVVGLMESLAASFRIAKIKPELEIRCVAPAMPPLMIDPLRLRQIVFNLLGNAAKFTERGHIELRASFAPSESGDYGTLTIEVEDTGCGISEEDLARIGSAYVQVGSRLGRNGGTGLGLAICRQLIAAMGGTMSVASEVGKGSTFSVTLPRVSVSDMKPVEESPVVGAVLDESVRSRRVLIVDDMPMNLMVATAHLRQLGMKNIETAKDGVEALAKIESAKDKPYDLVLTDMWMPNMDGAELAKSIRANPALAAIRVVAVTADVELQGKTSEVGFDSILLKPLTADKIAAALAAALAGGSAKS